MSIDQIWLWKEVMTCGFEGCSLYQSNELLLMGWNQRLQVFLPKHCKNNNNKKTDENSVCVGHDLVNQSFYLKLFLTFI